MKDLGYCVTLWVLRLFLLSKVIFCLSPSILLTYLSVFNLLTIRLLILLLRQVYNIPHRIVFISLILLYIELLLGVVQTLHILIMLLISLFEFKEHFIGVLFFIFSGIFEHLVWVFFVFFYVVFRLACLLWWVVYFSWWFTYIMEE